MNEPTQGAELTPLKRAYLAIEDLQQRLQENQRARNEPIAIVGAGCRLPGDANDLDAFWTLLRDGVDAVTETPADRWDSARWYDADLSVAGKMNTRHGGFINNVDQFDPQFFNISPREAAAMDPQQRLLLEVSWEALENAAIAPASLAGTRTGVYVAVTTNDYAQVHREARGVDGLDAYYASGIAHSIASGRISYVLGLQGPSLSIDTACSSSLVAVHLAVQSLRSGECRAALAGGVNLLLTPELSVTLSKYQMMAPDGRCKFGDARADGFVRAEGCAMVVLKRLRDALADGDAVLAVIRGSAANQDGASSGLTAPNGPAQEAVLRAALADAGVAPAEVGYVEAHGTGTALGDPIELQALGTVYGDGRADDAPLLVGSVKTNIGHGEAIAGVVGLLKLALVLQRGEVPPSLHFATPNPLIEWDEQPVAIATQQSVWPAAQTRRLGGVSAFGFSGTNVHMVLEGPPALPALQPAEPVQGEEGALQLLPLSARSETALRTLANRYARALSAADAPPLADVAHSAGSGRNHFAHRLAVIANSSAAAAAQLADFAAGGAPAIQTGHVLHVDPPTFAFLFTGQGAQYAGMGRTLYTTQPTFRSTLDKCASILSRHMDRPLLELLFAAPGSEGARLLDQTQYTQPALVALEIALAALWQSWGIAPTAVLGHSVGEFAAAYVAGVFSLEDALALVAARGRLMGQLPAGGAMAALFAAPARVEELLAALGDGADGVVIAAYNGPEHTVVSGPLAGVQALVDRATAAGLRAQRLTVSHAFHSPLIEPALAELEAVAARIEQHAPRVRLISDLTGEAVGREITQPDYWRRHARQPVRFAQSVALLGRLENTICIEIGPHPVLNAMAKAALPPGTGRWIHSLRKGRDDWEQLLNSVAALYTHGAEIDWAAFGGAALSGDRARRKVRLPTYPFEHERCWVSPLPTASRSPELPAANAHPLLGRRLRSALKQPQFESVISTEKLALLRDHRVFAATILPAAALFETALAAANVTGMAGAALQEVTIHTPLVVPPNEARTLQTILIPPVDVHAGAPAVTRFELLSQGSADDDPWLLHVSGTLAQAEETHFPPLADLRARCTQEFSHAQHYARMAAAGLDFGPSLRGLQQLWRGEGEVLGRVELPAEQAEERAQFRIHPALLDACLQSLSALTPEEGATFLPMHVEQVALLGTPGPVAWAHGALQPRATSASSGDSLLADVHIYDAQGQPLAALTGLLLKRAAPDTFNVIDDPTAWLYEVAWRAQPLADALSAASVVAPDRAVAAANAAVPQLAASLDMARYADQMEALDALATDFIVAALEQLGWQWQAGSRVNEAEMAAQLAIVPSQRALFGRFLKLLAEDGLLRARDGAWEVIRWQGAAAPSAASVDALLARYPAAAADIELARRCGAGLADVLCGAQDPLQLLFPNGSSADTERLYRESPWARLYTSLVAEGVAAFASAANRPLRILEVGAGTGGTTAAVLPRLSGSVSEYHFTDISPFFIGRARTNFAQYPFMRFAPLDIERDPQPQDFAPQSFDCIIAANVVHATADLRTTLSHLRELLAPGGLLILQEMTRPLRWIDITFGMTEGWWRFTDGSLRPDYVLLARAQWLALLAEVGFEEAGAAPTEKTGAADDLPYQSVLVAAASRAQGLRPLCIIADAGGFGEELAQLATANKRPVTTVRAESAVARTVDGNGNAPGTHPEWQRLLEEQGISATTDADIVYLWPLDAAECGGLDATQLMESEEQILGGALDLARALASSGSSARLWIVTRGAQPAGRSRATAVAGHALGLWQVDCA